MTNTGITGQTFIIAEEMGLGLTLGTGEIASKGALLYHWRKMRFRQDTRGSLTIYDLPVGMVKL